MTRSRTASPLPFPAKVPFAESLGLQLHAMADGRSAMEEAEVRITAELDGRPRPARRNELIDRVRPDSDDRPDSEDRRLRRAQ